MSQVVAMRAIQSSILSPTSESAHRRTAFKLKPPTSFSYKVMAFEEKQRGWSWRLFGNRRSEITAKRPLQTEVAPVSPEDSPKIEEQWKAIQQLYDPAVSMWSKPVVKRKTKIVCSIGPSTNTREMIWKLAVGSNCRTSIRRMMPHLTSKVRRSGGLRKIDDFTISVLSTVKPDHAAISVIILIIEYHRVPPPAYTTHLSNI